MKKREIKYIILSIVFVLLCINFVLAGVTVKSDSVSAKYSPGGTITGLVNLTFSGISSDAYLKTNFGENISLIDLLRAQSNFTFSCTTVSCGSSYFAVGSEASSKEYNLDAGESPILGFLVQGMVTSVVSGSFSLNITSDVTSSYTPQLTVDLLNDNSLEWISHKPAGTFGGRSYGCFNLLDTGQMVTLDLTGVCERITLAVSPQVMIGANLTKESGTSTMGLSIWDSKLSKEEGKCADIVVSSSGEISCIPKNLDGTDYFIKENGDFFVCLKQKPGSSGVYKIKIDDINSGTRCGFAGVPPPSTYAADYEIFASSGRFESVGSFSFNSSETAQSWYEVSNLESRIADYLFNEYGNNCTNKCVVPIGLNSELDQNVNLRDFSVDVGIQGVGNLEFNKLSSVSKTNSLISSGGYDLLSLNEANFSVPNVFGENNLELTLINGSQTYPILSKEIVIERIPQVVNVAPATTAAVLPTEFTANLNLYGSNSSIIRYVWNFGDGSPTQTTNTKTASHMYNIIGTFPLQVTIFNSAGLSSSASFNISVVSPVDAVKTVLNDSQRNLGEIESKLGSYPAFSQSSIKRILNLDSIKSKLQELQLLSNAATTDEQYMNIMRELIAINLPDSIEETSSSVSAPLLPSSSSINLEVLESVGAGKYEISKSSEYVDAIVLWGLENVNATVDYNEFSGVYGNSLAPIVNIVKININQISTDTAYLVIPPLEGIQLGQTSSQSKGYYYVPISSTPQTVQFATSESLSPINLPIFISPSLDELGVSAGGGGTGNKILILALVLGIAAVAGLTIYVLVGRWYQKKYEAYLFKDRNDLYNMINYVHRLKSRGVKEGEIEKNLRKSKWNAEQINYVIRKYARKRVGIPGFKK